MNVDIQVLSGYGGKAAAAILVTYQEKRILLDAGGSLEPNTDKGWEFPDKLDAIIISHDHIDHSTGLLDLTSDVPVYATEPVLQLLPAHLNLQQLPLKGQIEIQGITVTVGQAGHSLGGVWIHLALAQGIFYSGDFSLESQLFNFDLPPKAEIALVDASYALYDESLEQGKQKLQQLISRYEKIIMPVPATGRALEIALWLTQIGEQDWSLGADCLQLADLKNLPAQLFKPDIVKKFPASDTNQSDFNAWQASNHSYMDSAKIVICGDADGIAGEAGRLIEQARKNRSASTLTIYTGYLPEKAQKDVASGIASLVRWNVHPRSRDIHWLIEHLESKRCLPLFCQIENKQLWRENVSNCLVFDTHLRSKDVTDS